MYTSYVTFRAQHTHDVVRGNVSGEILAVHAMF